MKRRQFLQSAAAAAVGVSTLARAQEKPGTPAAAAQLQADILIAGAGFSGLSAAVTAARSGARVIVVEKRAYAGGDGILSAGIIASAHSVEHEAQKFQGKADPEAYWSLLERGVFDEPLSKVRDNMPLSPIYSGIFKHDPRVLRRSAQTSPEVAAFLKSFGVRFQPINPRQPFLLPSVPGAMPAFAQAMLKELERLRTPVMTNTAIVDLITEPDPDPAACRGAVRVMGAVFERDGRRLEVRAGAVILATGGFIDNMALLRRYKRFWADIPKGFSAVGEGVPPGHDGDGIRIGRLAGAALEDMESMPKLFAAPRPGQKSPSWILFDTDTAYLVDRYGRRLCNEHASRYAGCALECFRQKIDGAFVVFDDAVFSGPNRSRWGYEALLKNGGLFKGETIAEAAQRAGVSPEGLEKTLQTIARDAASGRGDSQFGRRDSLFRALKGPYYVSTPSSKVRFKTEGGLEVNPDFNVLRAADDAPIPGLYAAGAVCGSISTRLCDVIASGLIVGKTAAAGLRKPRPESGAPCGPRPAGGRIWRNQAQKPQKGLDFSPFFIDNHAFPFGTWRAYLA